MVTAPEPPLLEVENLRVRYGRTTALSGLSLQVAPREIVALLGPAHAGKTSLLRAVNRMNDFTPGMHVDGVLRFCGRDVATVRNVHELRRRIGVVFPLPTGLPLSIYDNVALSPRLRGIRARQDLDAIVERCLRRAALWDEVEDRLDALGSQLSGGQQQRLTIARALAQEPDLLLLDEFSIAIDPVTTVRIEEVLKELRNEMSIVLATSRVQQARRLADRIAFLWAGQCVEVGPTERLFAGDVQDRRTIDYLEGRIG